MKAFVRLVIIVTSNIAGARKTITINWHAVMMTAIAYTQGVLFLQQWMCNKCSVIFLFFLMNLHADCWPEQQPTMKASAAFCGEMGKPLIIENSDICGVNCELTWCQWTNAFLWPHFLFSFHTLKYLHQLDLLQLIVLTCSFIFRGVIF